jgi:hypothetical protein
MEEYIEGPQPEALDDVLGGGWGPLRERLQRLANDMPSLGLAPWDRLSPQVRERLEQWTPDARALWESDFRCHQVAMVRAWIWHYLDDNLFAFSPSAGAGELVKCSAPVWEHVRLLWQDLDDKCVPARAPD